MKLERAAHAKELANLGGKRLLFLYPGLLARRRERRHPRRTERRLGVPAQKLTKSCELEDRRTGMLERHGHGVFIVTRRESLAACSHAHGFVGVRRGFAERRQTNEEGSAAFRAVVATNMALVLLDDAVSRAQSQASPLADRLRGVERIEDAAGVFQSGPVVGDLDADCLPLAVGVQQHLAAAAFR